MFWAGKCVGVSADPNSPDDRQNSAPGRGGDGVFVFFCFFYARSNGGNGTKSVLSCVGV